MISVQDATVRYPRFCLGPMSLELQVGERVALLGRNGAGKSTLLALMGGNRHATTGRVSLSNASLVLPGTEADQRLQLRRHVAYVGAGIQALPWYTVRRHFEFLARIHERWNGARAMDLARTLRLDLDAVTGSLSRGNLVKLNLCSGWGQEASVLLLDEPTAGLDPIARADLLVELQLYMEAHREGTVVYATHLLDELKVVAPSRLLVLTDGRLSEFSPHETNDFDVATMTQLMTGQHRAHQSRSVEVFA